MDSLNSLCSSNLVLIGPMGSPLSHLPNLWPSYHDQRPHSCYLPQHDNDPPVQFLFLGHSAIPMDACDRLPCSDSNGRSPFARYTETGLLSWTSAAWTTFSRAAPWGRFDRLGRWSVAGAICRCKLRGRSARTEAGFGAYLLRDTQTDIRSTCDVKAAKEVMVEVQVKLNTWN